MDIPDNLHSWLKEFAPKEGAVVQVKDSINIPPDRSYAAGIVWKQNALGTSFVLTTYRNIGTRR